MAKADPNAKWYQDQLARNRARRAARALAEGREPGTPGTAHLRRDDALNRDPKYHRDKERRRTRVLCGWPAHLLDAPAGTSYHRPGPRVRPRQPPRPPEPLPGWYNGHPLYDAARVALTPPERDELAAGDMDSKAADLVGTYVLAVFEGCDPVAAMRAWRRRYEHDRRVLLHGLARVDDLIR